MEVTEIVKTANLKAEVEEDVIALIEDLTEEATEDVMD